MRIMTGIGTLEIILSRSNVAALLAAIDDDREGPDGSSRTVFFPGGVKREHWHPGALTDRHELTLQVTVESDEEHPSVEEHPCVAFEIQTWGELMAELGIEPSDGEAS